MFTFYDKEHLNSKGALNNFIKQKRAKVAIKDQILSHLEDCEGVIGCDNIFIMEDKFYAWSRDVSWQNFPVSKGCIVSGFVYPFQAIMKWSIKKVICYPLHGRLFNLEFEGVIE